MSRLKQIRSFGQSIWLDFLSRDLIESGGLHRLIDEDGISGVTTNPTIFEKAVSGGTAYDGAVASMAAEGKSAVDMYRRLTLRDVAAAADMLHPVYEITEGGDGFVSIEVSPHLAYDSGKTVAEARDLWAALDRPNVLIKVPATEPGLAAVRRLIGEGVNVNVTLLFGLARYEAVARAYVAGLEDRLAAGHSLRHGPVSVASFFLSRIDTLVDSLLEEKAAAAGEDPHIDLLRGETAIACARLAYSRFRIMFSSESFHRLAGHGARPQRLLWASTSTKNPDYPDTKYVEPLIGKDTVNTLPLQTLDAYRDHGLPEQRLERDPDRARSQLAVLEEYGIDMHAVAARLEREGVQKFIDSYDRLLHALEEKCTAVNA